MKKKADRHKCDRKHIVVPIAVHELALKIAEIEDRPVGRVVQRLIIKAAREHGLEVEKTAHSS